MPSSACSPTTCCATSTRIPSKALRSGRLTSTGHSPSPRQAHTVSCSASAAGFNSTRCRSSPCRGWAEPPLDEDPAEPDRSGNGFRTRARVELAKHRARVELDGVLADLQAPRDLAICQTARHPLQDLGLARRERFGGRPERPLDPATLV